MPFNETNSEDLFDGLGDEILPTRGMPFEEVSDEAGEDPVFGAPRDVAPEELYKMFAEEQAVESHEAGRSWLDAPSGMGASEPVLTDGDFEALDLPQPTGADEPSSFDSQPDVSLGVYGGSPQLVSHQRLGQLWQRIDKAQQELPEKVPNLQIARKLIVEMERARSLMMEGAENYEEAERAISEVELRIAAAERAKADSGAALALFLYELIWAICLIAFFVGVTGRDLNDQMILVQSAAWGGLGGAANALYALWKHVSRELDFSKHYALWYITNPITGSVLGAFVFLVTKLGLLSLSGGTTQIQITTPIAIYILAFVVGYQQNVAWDLMRRVLKVFRLGDGEG